MNPGTTATEAATSRTERNREPGVALFCADLDGTLLGKADAEWRFYCAWAAIRRERRPLLVYNTGRDVTDVHELVRLGRLPCPDAIIGTEATVLDFPKRPGLAELFAREFGPAWDAGKAEQVLAGFPGLIRQLPTLHHPYRWKWAVEHPSPELLGAVQVAFAERGMRVEVSFSAPEGLKVLPATSNKGTALHWLCEHTGIPLSRVLVAGDSEEDASMFRLPEVSGILVSNALPALKERLMDPPPYSSPDAFADGVLDGLRRAGVVLSVAPKE